MIVHQIDRDYSQWGEQPIVLDVLSKMGSLRGNDGALPRFLDLGAFDGLTGSNTRALSDQGWKGVLVEADPRAFQQLVANHRTNDKMQCVLGAVVGKERTNNGDREGEDRKHTGSLDRVRPFYDAGPQVSTAYGGHRLGDMVEGKWWTVCMTPFELAAVFGSRFEFVSVDVEGCDLDVIKALRPVLTHTRLVVYEDALPNADFDSTYYESLRRAWAELGFNELVARTVDSAGRPANTILARAEKAKGHPEKVAGVGLKSHVKPKEIVSRWKGTSNEQADAVVEVEVGAGAGHQPGAKQDDGRGVEGR